MPEFKDRPDEDLDAVESHYINLNLTTENVASYKPRFGLRVMDDILPPTKAILDKMVLTGNKTALIIEVTSVHIGEAYHIADIVDDDELDIIMGTNKKLAPVFQPQSSNKKKSEPVLFWINYKVTTPFAQDEKGEHVVIKTDSTGITKKAPKQLLSDLLKASKGLLPILVEVDVVRDAHPIHTATLIGNLDDIK
jgi:hypothetical protein